MTKWRYNEKELFKKGIVSIGQDILVHSSIDFTYDENGNRKIFKTDYSIPCHAKITGIGIRYLGKMDAGYVSYNGFCLDPEYVSSTFKPSQTIKVILFRTGMVNKEQMALLEDVELSLDKGKFPYSDNGMEKWTEEKKESNKGLIEYLRTFAKFSNRDSKGRFLKTTTEEFSTNIKKLAKKEIYEEDDFYG